MSQIGLEQFLDKKVHITFGSRVTLRVKTASLRPEVSYKEVSLSSASGVITKVDQGWLYIRTNAIYYDEGRQLHECDMVYPVKMVSAIATTEVD